MWGLSETDGERKLQVWFWFPHSSFCRITLLIWGLWVWVPAFHQLRTEMFMVQFMHNSYIYPPEHQSWPALLPHHISMKTMWKKHLFHVTITELFHFASIATIDAISEGSRHCNWCFLESVFHILHQFYYGKMYKQIDLYKLNNCYFCNKVLHKSWSFYLLSWILTRRYQILNWATRFCQNIILPLFWKIKRFGFDIWYDKHMMWALC